MLLLQEILHSNGKETWVKHIETFHKQWFDNSQSISVNTSGSTGKPKPIIITKKAMIASAKNTIAHFNIPKQANALLCLPANFIAGKMMIVRSIVGHWSLFVTPPTSAIDFESKQFDFVAMTPHQVIATIAKYGSESFSNIKTLIIGGGEIPTNKLQVITNLPCSVFSTYGMTETITHIATKAILNENQPYITLPGVKISVNKNNCLVIQTNYLEQPIVTNDIVNLLGENKFEWIGRHDNVINSGGIKLVPEQLESELVKKWVNPFFFYGQTHNILGQQLVLVVTLNSNITELKTLLISTFEKLKLPKQIWIVNHFHFTETGKINRQKSVENVLEKIHI